MKLRDMIQVMANMTTRDINGAKRTGKCIECGSGRLVTALRCKSCVRKGLRRLEKFETC